MAFQETCSCHVWAIDGYRNDARSTSVNNFYDAESNRILFEDDPNFIGDLDALVAHLVTHCRSAVQSYPTAWSCIIYGGFYNLNDGAPAHMWLETGGYIYDTMPGRFLERVQATDLTRRHPACENNAFNEGLIGQVEVALTRLQQQIIHDGQAFFQLYGRYNPPGS